MSRTLSLISARRAASCLVKTAVNTELRCLGRVSLSTTSHRVPQTIPRFCRALHPTPTLRDRSFTNLLADDNPPAVQVSSISSAGIQLVDGLLLPGSCIFLEGKVFLWDVPATNAGSKVKEERWREWNKELFEIFEVVNPRPGEATNQFEVQNIH